MRAYKQKHIISISKSNRTSRLLYSMQITWNRFVTLIASTTKSDSDRKSVESFLATMCHTLINVDVDLEVAFVTKFQLFAISVAFEYVAFCWIFHKSENIVWISWWSDEFILSYYLICFRKIIIQNVAIGRVSIGNEPVRSMM